MEYPSAAQSMAAAAINAGLRKQLPPVVKSNDNAGKKSHFSDGRLPDRFSALFLFMIGFMYGRAQ
jgi:hypothetical protein